MSSSASSAPAASSVANAARASDTVSVADASRARSLASAPAANVASGRAAVASSTSRRPSTNRPRTDRPTTSRTASRGRPSASPRARARRNEASESPSTPLATSLSPAASAGPPNTSVSPSTPSTSSTSADGLPPARIVSRPAATAGVDPMTGACRYAAPVVATRASSATASSGPTVVVLTTVVRADSAGRTAASTSRQAGPSYRQRSTTSAPSTATVGEPPALRVQVRTSWTSARRAAMAAPIRPRPRTATEVMRTSLARRRDMRQAQITHGRHALPS